jgi:hypothetical protein
VFILCSPLHLTIFVRSFSLPPLSLPYSPPFLLSSFFPPPSLSSSWFVSWFGGLVVFLIFFYFEAGLIKVTFQPQLPELGLQSCATMPSSSFLLREPKYDVVFLLV